MKKMMMVGFAIFWTACTAFAQEPQAMNEGSIVYEEVIKLDIKLEGDAAQFADMMPKEQKSKKMLYFNPEYALYEKYTEADADAGSVQAVESEGAMIQVQMVQPDDKLFTDFKKKQQIEQREFMGRRFLIKGDIESHNWKFTGNSREISGLRCMEAFYENEKGEKVKVWFSPEIPVASGPGHFAGLPGMVLAVDINDGDHTITAVKMDRAKVSKDILEKPKKGKKVTADEYDAIVKEKMEEMGVEGGGTQVQTVIEIKN